MDYELITLGEDERGPVLQAMADTGITDIDMFNKAARRLLVEASQNAKISRPLATFAPDMKTFRRIYMPCLEHATRRGEEERRAAAEKPTTSPSTPIDGRTSSTLRHAKVA